MAKYEIGITGKILLGIVLSLSVGALGTVFTIAAIPSWYAYLNKPEFTPPSWLFGPAWTILFILMGTAIGLIWSERTDKNKDQATSAFFIQLVLNLIWSIIFFGLKQTFLAGLEIWILWAFILICITEFKRISKIASFLLWPYLAWVSFAGILNWAIVVLNW